MGFAQFIKPVVVSPGTAGAGASVGTWQPNDRFDPASAADWHSSISNYLANGPKDGVGWSPMPVADADDPREKWRFDGGDDDVSLGASPGIAVKRGDTITIYDPGMPEDKPPVDGSWATSNTNYWPWLQALRQAGAKPAQLYEIPTDGGVKHVYREGAMTKDENGNDVLREDARALSEGEMWDIAGKGNKGRWELPATADLSGVPQLRGQWVGAGGKTLLSSLWPALAMFGGAYFAGASGAAGGAGGTASGGTAIGTGLKVGANTAASLGGGSMLSFAPAVPAATAPGLSMAAAPAGLAAPTAATFGTGSIGFSGFLASNFTPQNLAKSAIKNAGMQLLTTGKVDPKGLVTGVVTGGVAGAVGSTVGEAMGSAGVGSTLAKAAGSGVAGATGAILNGGNPVASGFSSMLGSFVGNSIGGGLGQVAGSLTAGLVNSKLQDPKQGAVSASTPQNGGISYRNPYIDAAWSWRSPNVT